MFERSDYTAQPQILQGLAVATFNFVARSSEMGHVRGFVCGGGCDAEKGERRNIGEKEF